MPPSHSPWPLTPQQEAGLAPNGTSDGLDRLSRAMTMAPRLNTNPANRLSANPANRFSMHLSQRLTISGRLSATRQRSISSTSATTCNQEDMEAESPHSHAGSEGEPRWSPGLRIHTHNNGRDSVDDDDGGGIGNGRDRRV
jgi:hypothetical protein